MPVTASNAGAFQLKVIAGAGLKDAVGNSLGTTTILTVNAAGMDAD